MLHNPQSLSGGPTSHGHMILGCSTSRQRVHRGGMAQDLVLWNWSKNKTMTIWVRTPKLFESFTKKLFFLNSVNVILIYRVHQPNAAAVQCAIMKPELSPPSLTRKAGSSLREGLHNLSILLSLIEANSWTAIDKKSRAYEKRKCDARSQKKL